MEETVYKAPRAQEGRTGLVLEGGGMRGIYTAGVLDVFMENGIGFDGVMGVSRRSDPRLLPGIRPDGPQYPLL